MGEKPKIYFAGCSCSEALHAVVHAAGGPRKVGVILWPNLPADRAAAKVRDCLSQKRRERFAPDQVMYLLRLGRDVGCHALMDFMAREAGYADPQPIEPEDELARLQREFVALTKSLSQMAVRIEAIAASKALIR